ncbi:hypothetical protein SEPCBS119000_002561 [Sporothrix epigloea]|uniref:RING-CH-type domain-containing protein n=1 Tax=Sporothrix epigloea TaxID=1892477 RepID=A0ABP0DKA3_9PEZI
MDSRSSIGTDGPAPRWQWSAATGGEGVAAAPKDEAWAATSGVDIGSRLPPPLQPTLHDDEDDVSYSTGSPGHSTAGDASWITDDGTRTPLEHNSFHYRRGDEYQSDAGHSFVSDHESRASLPPRRSKAEEDAEEAEEAEARYKRRFKPRICRICFDLVLPTFEYTAENSHADIVEEAEHLEPVGLGAAFNAVSEATASLRDRVTGAVASAVPAFMRTRKIRVCYISDNPEDGRLISPCLCKGSQKYVHEGCLQSWRMARPLAERNFWKCPTCGYEYRMQRLSWGKLVSNKITRACLTLLLFCLTIFVLGFVADPLMDLWTDPTGLILDTFLDLDDLDASEDFLVQVHDAWHGGSSGSVVGDFVEPASWWEHFAKGFFSLGIVGMVKTFFVISPFTWMNLRSIGLGRRRRRVGGGSGRYDSMGWVFVFVGAFTFLVASWKGISYVCGRFLERASERIIDIGAGEPDEDDEDVSDDASQIREDQHDNAEHEDRKSHPNNHAE